jgi:hypothetical protein
MMRINPPTFLKRWYSSINISYFTKEDYKRLGFHKINIHMKRNLERGPGLLRK